MSRSIDLFIHSSLPLEELAEELTRVTGVAFAPTADGAGWLMRDGEVEAELAEHHFADDGDLLLSRYPYALSARAPIGGNPADTPAAASLRRMAKALHGDGSMLVLLVLDLQYRDHLGGPGGVRSAGSGGAGPTGEPATPRRTPTVPTGSAQPGSEGDRRAAEASGR